MLEYHDISELSLHYIFVKLCVGCVFPLSVKTLSGFFPIQLKYTETLRSQVDKYVGKLFFQHCEKACQDGTYFEI